MLILGVSSRLAASRFASAIALAGIAGFWCGSLGEKDAVDPGRRLSDRSRGDGPQIDSRPVQSDANFIRDSLYRRNGEQEQWQHVRDWSEAQVKAAIAEIGDQPAPSHFTAMLFYRWGQLDPVAADAAAKKMNPVGFLFDRRAVVTAWIKEDPAAAWAALRGETELYYCSESVAKSVAKMLVANFADENDATAFREIAALEDEEHFLPWFLVEARVRKAAASSESRAAFLAAAANYPDPEVLMVARERLFIRWAQVDPEAALVGLAGMDIPPDERGSMETQIREIAEEQEPSAAEPQPAAP